jgi:hypothetical protein
MCADRPESDQISTQQQPNLEDLVCAVQEERCKFSGRKIVRFWFYDADADAYLWRDKMHEDGVNCTSIWFDTGDGKGGDPAPGKTKRCSILPYDPKNNCRPCVCHENKNNDYWGVYTDCWVSRRPGHTGVYWNLFCHGESDEDSEARTLAELTSIWKEEHVCTGEKIGDFAHSKSKCIAACENNNKCKCVTWMGNHFFKKCRLETGTSITLAGYRAFLYSAALIHDPALYAPLDYGGHTEEDYESRWGMGSCLPAIQEGFSSTSFTCVRFPFAGEVFGPFKKVGSVLNFFGEFQACNRPATNWSFVSYSTKGNGCGDSVLGRIDFACQYGFIPGNCWPTGGVLTMNRDWIAYASPECIVSRAGFTAKLGLKPKTRKNDFTNPLTKKKESQLLNLQGVTTAALYLGWNDANQGLDICVALIGTLSVEVLTLVGMSANVKGQVIVHTTTIKNNKFAPSVTLTVRFEGEVRILAGVFKITCKVNWNNIEGWYWDFYLPSFLKGDDLLGRRQTAGSRPVHLGRLF